MLYVQRGENGEITAIHKQRVDGAEELTSLADPEIIEFFDKNDDTHTYKELLSFTDMGLVRVLEDLVEVLVKKNIIRFTDLPEDAQRKIIDRKHARNSLDDTGIMVSENNIL